MTIRQAGRQASATQTERDQQHQAHGDERQNAVRENSRHREVPLGRERGRQQGYPGVLRSPERGLGGCRGVSGG